MDLGLDGDVALCTAASSGLGLACAESLAGEGADVVVCGRTPERLSEAKATLEALGNGAVAAIEADLTDRDAVEALVETTVERFDGLDHLVTSSGGPPSGPFMEMSDADWYDAYDGLVMSAVWAVRAAAPHLEASEAGTWTAIASRTTREVKDGLVLSNAVRRTVLGLMKTVSRELAPEIRANAVQPGAHETTRIEDLIDASVERGEVPDYEAGYDDWASNVPLGRLGEPQELGDVVAFLASNRASYVNGAALAVDGGSLRSV